MSIYGNQVGYGTEQLAKCDVAGIGQYVPPTKRQQLQNKKDALEGTLAKVNDAIKALDENPNLEQFINAIEQASY